MTTQMNMFAWEISSHLVTISVKKYVIAVFREEYPIQPNADDVTRLVENDATRGFLLMLGSIGDGRISLGMVCVVHSALPCYTRSCCLRRLISFALLLWDAYDDPQV